MMRRYSTNKNKINLVKTTTTRPADTPAHFKLANILIRVATAFAYPTTESIERSSYENQEFKQIGKRSIDIKPVLRLDLSRDRVERNVTGMKTAPRRGNEGNSTDRNIKRKSSRSTSTPPSTRIMGGVREMSTSAYRPNRGPSNTIATRDEISTQAPSPLDIAFDDASNLDIEVDGVGDGIIEQLFNTDQNNTYRAGDLILGCWLETRRYASRFPSFLTLLADHRMLKLEWGWQLQRSI